MKGSFSSRRFATRMVHMDGATRRNDAKESVRARAPSRDNQIIFRFAFTGSPPSDSFVLPRARIADCAISDVVRSIDRAFARLAFYAKAPELRESALPLCSATKNRQRGETRI